MLADIRWRHTRLMITVRTEVLLYIYNFTSVISGSRPIYDEHLPNGSGPLVSNRSLSLLLAFLSFCFSEIPGFCIGTRHRGDWRGRRYCFLFLFVCFLFCFSFFRSTVQFGRGFRWEPWDFQTRYHSVQELF